jgi:prepilin-type N-terminal cleavage/methylation domain-containing protein
MNKTWNKPKSTHGFTLIELLLVMSLMGLATSLVAPKLFSAYRKVQIQVEEKQVYNLLNAISYSAFIRNHSIKVILKKNGVSVGGKSLLNLEHIRFSETELTFIQSGFCDYQKIEYQTDNETRIMSLSNI